MEISFKSKNKLIIIIDANKKNLKSLFKDTFERELKERLVYNESKKSTDLLNKLNYDIQANPRELNLFYIEKQSREIFKKTRSI